MGRKSKAVETAPESERQQELSLSYSASRLDFNDEDTILDAQDANQSQAKGSARRKGSASNVVRWAESKKALDQKAIEAMQRQSKLLEETVLQDVLPLWTDMRRAVPNSFVRSGLFGTGNGAKRKNINGVIASMGHISLAYRGEELLQDDLSVWLALINLARRQKAVDAVYFTGYQLIKDLGWRVHTESFARAKASIERMKANSIKVVSSGKQECGYAGSLVREFGYAERCSKDVKWWVRFEPRIANLFLSNDVTFLWWEQRKLIGSRFSLALWLHGFFTSHTDPLPLTLQVIKQLSRTDKVRNHDFAKRVKAALERLVEVGCLEKFAISGDRVIVTRATPQAQSARFNYANGRNVLPFEPSAQAS